MASYYFRHRTTHSLSSAEKLEKDSSFKGAPVWCILVSEANLNITPLPVYWRKRRSRVCNSDTLLALANNISVTNFSDNCFKERLSLSPSCVI